MPLMHIDVANNSTGKPATVADSVISGMVITFILILVIVLCLLGACSLRSEERVGNRDSMSTEGRQRQDAKRKEFLKKNLVLRQWTSDRVSLDVEKEPTTSEEKVRRPTTDKSTDAGKEGCAICLAGFESGQLVCESNNSLCKHVFHAECFARWLFYGAGEVDAKYRCPVCRQIYVFQSETIEV